MDKRTNKVYPTEIVTLIHLGVTHASFYEEDFASEGVQSLFEGSNIMYNLGLPTPGLFKRKIARNKALAEQLRHEDIFGTVLMMKDSPGKKSTQTFVFNLIHMVCQKDRSDLLTTLGKSRQVAYISCPVAPIRYAHAHTAKVMYQLMQNRSPAEKECIYSKFKLADLLSILHLPDRERYGFFKDLCTKSIVFGDSFTCEENAKYAEIDHLYLL